MKKIYEVECLPRGAGKYKYAYRMGYYKAINDLIERMENGNLEDYVDPYEIGGFMLCLKNAADELKEEILNDPYR